MNRPRSSFAIKAEVNDLSADTFSFMAQKSMYGGKHVATGDRIFIFASENEGGSGLFARGIVTSHEDVPRTAAARQTPRVTITIKRTGTSRSPLGRAELRAARGGSGDDPEVELDFKLYRQATNKIIGLSDGAGEFLNQLF
jgi:hypothetical protein